MFQSGYNQETLVQEHCCFASIGETAQTVGRGAVVDGIHFDFAGRGVMSALAKYSIRFYDQSKSRIDWAQGSGEREL
jgi:hypothetical protein